MKFTQTKINWVFAVLVAILYTSLIMFSTDTNQKLSWYKDLIVNDIDHSENYITKSDYQVLAHCINNQSQECKEILAEIANTK